METDLRRRIGENIKGLTRRRGISLRELSKLAKVGEAQVYRVVRGEAWASDDWLARIAKTLGVHASMLLDADANVATMVRTEVEPMGDLNKEESLRMRIDASDRARLDALSAHYALPVSAVVRMLVKRDADATGVVLATKKKAKHTK